MDDTGATTALIFEADLDQIQDTSGCDATSLGPIYAKTANGAVSRETYRLEVNIITPDHEELLDTWVPIQVTVVPGSQQADSPPRLSGMWMRHMLYTATCPDNKGYLYISNSLGGLTSQMPTVNAKDALPPPDAKPDWVNSRTLPPLPDHVGPFPSPKTVLRKVLPSDSTPTVDNGGMLPPSPLPSKRKQPLDGAESVADIDGAEAADQAKGRWTLTLRGKKRPKQAKRS